MSAVRSRRSESYEPLVRFVCQLVNKEAGIVLGEKQATMVETRVKKRMIDLSLQFPSEYIDYIKRNFLEEKEQLVSALTTHHTYFFREFQQVEALLKLLPDVIERAKARGKKELRLWSAACSRGQEAYTLSMFLDFHLKKIDPEMNFKIVGSDIDSNSVKIAQNAVYNKKEIFRVPAQYLASHWAKGTGRIADFVKAKNSLKSHCEFKVCNLLDIQGIQGKFDIIFIRNVLIYFTEDDIAKITKGLCEHSEKGGLIVCGASETLSGYGDKLQRIAPYIYQYGETPKTKEPQKAVVQELKPETDKILRVVTVDDSPSVLKLLKKILTEEHGFEIVGSAENGIQANEQIEKLKPDLVTLDIHMPEMTGLEYLEKHFYSNHPPVVMISSASRGRL